MKSQVVSEELRTCQTSPSFGSVTYLIHTELRISYKNCSFALWTQKTNNPVSSLLARMNRFWQITRPLVRKKRLTLHTQITEVMSELKPDPDAHLSETRVGNEATPFFPTEKETCFISQLQCRPHHTLINASAQSTHTPNHYSHQEFLGKADGRGVSESWI